ncbi:hypothetical protein Q3V37_24550 [Micromonospora profundi]|uniref:Uncharacterized protein n=1 Tax=Micromonospora profundi TaxID=1420889 RepID=A0AAJ6HU07_9ACTN|nr:hypothetical protein [Micromonospora profundi]WLS44528.1 hypothetical protein Q3V37_24550 [Micromonospora profundi]
MAPEADGSENELSVPADHGPDTAVPPGDDPVVSLVEIEPGVAVLFADQPPVGLDLIPFEMMSAQASRRLTDNLAMASGIANLAAQGAQGLTTVQGLVRLAPETLQALKTAQPMTSGGWNLGSLVTSNGKIAASVRWAPVTGAQTASILSALGPAAALLALQVQLASISRRIDENVQLTRDVLQALHEDQWTTLLGLHETTMRAVRESQAAGTVNDHIFASIATRDADLRKQRLLFRSLVRGHIKALDTDGQSRRAHIQKNIEQILADTHGMLMAEWSWYRSQVLRAGHISRDEANAAENERLLAELVADTQREHTSAMDEVSNLLADLERQCRLIAELPAERSLPFTAKRQSIRDSVRMAEALAERVAALRNRAHTQPAPLDPPVTVFSDAVPDELLRILRWIVPGGEPLLAIADVNLDRLVGEDAYLGVTPERFFISAQNAVRKQGTIEREFPLSEIRYVRFRERDKRGPVLDVITTDENIRLTFDDWAGKGKGLDDAQRLGNLLAAAMDLPESERRTDPLLIGESPTREAIAAS